jgi:hypothetical protein
MTARTNSAKISSYFLFFFYRHVAPNSLAFERQRVVVLGFSARIDVYPLYLKNPQPTIA